MAISAVPFRLGIEIRRPSGSTRLNGPRRRSLNFEVRINIGALHPKMILDGTQLSRFFFDFRTRGSRSANRAYARVEPRID